ncbi:MAG: DegT/DnrJ/EryC1/StrS family aminotransferase [Planctomycetes bacterium]|jgi:dTDP-4-amino-4,6-dideoxygalactose transaminase|nr:DegT/DnrJ/EryC1/StrS family aminotransferase [Planctomycetota bacterium]
MWVRLQLDFRWRDLTHGMASLVTPHRLAALSDAIERRFSPAGNAIATLSVRSGFDLLLGAQDWPTGSEIVFSALNIPDMAMVARQRGLVPVPVDLDLESLAPNLAQLERAITPRTRAILIAHLYGNFVPLEPILALARRHNLMLIEDAAEIYDGVYHGHPDADVSLFSFGPLKTATALAGGVLRARDGDLIVRLRHNHANWPRQGRWDYFKRMCKYGTLKLFGSKWLYGAVRNIARLAVGDVDKLIHHSAKSFREDEIMMRLRQQPCGPLLASMARRLANFDSTRIAQRTANGRLLAALLHGKIFCPGAEAESHNYWLFPAMVSDPRTAIDALKAAGFDVTNVQSMCAIAAPVDRPELEAVRVQEALDRMILLPCYPGIPETELRRMAEVLTGIEVQANQVTALKIAIPPGLAATPQACVEAERAG